MKYQPSLIVAFIVTLCLLFTSMAPAQVTRIKVGYSSIGVGQSLVWVVKEAGLFKENGLDVQLIFIGSSSILTHSLNKLLPLRSDAGQELLHNVLVRPLGAGPAPTAAARRLARESERTRRRGPPHER